MLGITDSGFVVDVICCSRCLSISVEGCEIKFDLLPWLELSVRLSVAMLAISDLLTTLYLIWLMLKRDLRLSISVHRT